MTDSMMQGPSESIAIVGMQGRFPGAADIEQFWKNLCEGVESISDFSVEELAEAGIDEATRKTPGFVPRGSIIDGIEMFDAQFFGYSPRDAEVIDPQQRLFLECCWEALEKAGYNPDRYPGLIGVYAGSEQSSYFYQLFGQGGAYLTQAMASIGNDKDYLTTQVSYRMNLRGPSLAVQTACSTSLVAVGLACQSLLSFQCDMALAGGVCVMVPQKKGYYYQPGGIVSPDGHCRTFDASGQGTVVGSGVGVVALKRLSEAIASGDRIHAVIRGAGVNNDGSMKVGFGAPSVEGQAQVIAMAQAMAGISPETIESVEAHGTATLLGDPIEMAALNQVFGAATAKRSFCAIGSLKSNMGHLASAAGVAGLIKMALELEREAIPPSLHFRRPNPQINFGGSPFYVNTKLRDWKRRPGNPRRGAVSSFGVGGTNAHAVLEEAPLRGPSGPARPCQLLPVSAKTPGALNAACANLAGYLEQHHETNLADIAHTLQVGRKEFRHRRILVARPEDSRHGLAALLRENNPQRTLSGDSETRERPVLYLFSGQGSQYVDMGRDLYESEPLYRQHIDACATILKPHLGLDLRDILYPNEEHRKEAAELLGRTAYTQPALFAVEYALAALWMQWGVPPKAMVGHSIGEYVAACLAQVFSLEDALAIVALRGHLMDQMEPGSMLAVPMAELDLKALLTGGLCLAAVNGPQMCVAAGPNGEVAQLEALLSARGVKGRKLHTSHAFHSAMMEPAVAQFVKALEAFRFNPPQIPFFSNLTGSWATPELVMDPGYWGKHLRNPVRFSDCLSEVAKIPELVYLEVGPGQALSALTRQQPGRAPDQLILSSIRTAQETGHDLEFALASLGRMWLAGMPVLWEGLATDEKRHRVELPTYPFEKQRFWVDSGASIATLLAGATPVVKEQKVDNWFYAPTWKQAAQTKKPEAVEGRWVVFGDAGELTANVLSRLREKKAEVVLVRSGKAYAAQGDTFTIRPDVRADYEEAIKALAGSSRLPDWILHLWSASALPKKALAADGFEGRQTEGFQSVVYLGQALESQRVNRKIRLAAVTRGVHAALGDEPLCPARATILGALKVVAQELPNLRCRNIDVTDQTAAVADQVIHELAVEPFAPVVAYRKGKRWVQSYEPVKLSAVKGKPAVLRQKGVYVITGGLGKIGLALAGYLATNAKARLVLIGRSEFPAREAWDAWLDSHEETEATSERIRKLIELESNGAEVAVYAADTADRAQIKKVLRAAQTRFGPVNGLIHAAGNTSADGYGPLGQTDTALAARQFRPKVQGLHTMEEALTGTKLDFVALTSSLSAVLGGLGLLSYASANAYLDAVAAQRNQEGAVPWISVNWDAWMFPEDAAAGSGSQENPILPAAGVEAFGRILNKQARQVVVSTGDLQARLNKWVNLESMNAPAEKADSAGLHSRPNLSTQFVEPRNEQERVIARIWEQILGVTPIGVFDKFFELGGHSLLAVQLISELRQAFQVELSAQKLFEAPSVAQLSGCITAELDKSKVTRAEQEQARLAEMLEFVEKLSEEEVAELLGKEGALEQELTHGGD